MLSGKSSSFTALRWPFSTLEDPLTSVYYVNLIRLAMPALLQLNVILAIGLLSAGVIELPLYAASYRLPLRTNGDTIW